MKERLQKILSAHGVASRRESEQLIVSGRVLVNGKAAVLGESADTACDAISVDGVPLRCADDKIYIMLNKPRGYVTTMKDEKGRKNVTELVTDCGVRVYPVGRLDIDSEGLLLMTNDGELTNLLTHPSSEKKKTYLVSAAGDVEAALKPLGEPMEIDGYTISPAVIQLITKTKAGGVLSITIHEGRNRQIRKMCAKTGLQVKFLRRIEEDGLRLGSLKTGTWRFLSQSEISSLKQRRPNNTK